MGRNTASLFSWGGPNYWEVGDVKEVSISGSVGIKSFSGKYYCFILGFDHNQAYEGTGIHFQFGKSALENGVNITYVDSKVGTTVQNAVAFHMNATVTNAGGWKNSYMRNTLCAAFLEILPEELRSVISNCTKYTDNTGGAAANKNDASLVTSTEDKIFLLSEFEVKGVSSKANQYEASYQAQYQYYANGNSALKYKDTSTGSKTLWWLRSPYYDTSYYNSYFALINNSGVINTAGAAGSYGFSPAFKI